MEGGLTTPEMSSNELLTEEALLARMARLFRHGGVGPRASCDITIDGEATIEFCAHAKPAAIRFKQQYKGSTCMSPDRPELPLDELKMLGYLAADVYNRQLLGDTEAERIGKRIYDRWVEEKAKKDKAR